MAYLSKSRKSTGTYKQDELLPLVVHFLHRMLPYGFVHDPIYPHLLEGTEVEVGSWKQERRQRLDEKCPLITIWVIHWDVPLKASMSFPVEVLEPGSAWQRGWARCIKRDIHPMTHRRDWESGLIRRSLVRLILPHKLRHSPAIFTVPTSIRPRFSRNKW